MLVEVTLDGALGCLFEFLAHQAHAGQLGVCRELLVELHDIVVHYLLRFLGLMTFPGEKVVIGVD